MKILIIPISKNLWNRKDFQSSIEDAIGAAQRIAKKINTKQERKRFSIACSCIERVAMENMGDDKIEFEGKDAYKIVSTLRKEKSGITFIYPFVLPKEMSKFQNLFKGKVLRYFNKIKNGIVIIFLPYQKLIQNLRVAPIPSFPKNAEADIPLTVFNLNPQEYYSELKDIKRVDSQIKEAISSRYPFNASSPSHQLFTEVIRNYIYKPRISFLRYLLRKLMFWCKFPPIQLRIIYSDGTEARPFPLFCIPKTSKEPKKLPIIHAGLMSMRHADLDSLIDIYLIRNKEIDRQENAAEKDEFAYNRVLELLKDILKEKKKIKIYLYHTGFEPVVVGIYRAILKMLQQHKGQLVIVPKLPKFKNKKIIGYKEVKPWF